jgi:hypothetical protein
MSSIENFRSKLKDTLNKQIQLQHSLKMDQNDSQDIIESLQSGELIVSVAGEINRGKSTFLNALMGNKIFPSRATVCTAGVTVLDNGESPLAEVVFNNGNKEKIDLTEGEPAKILANHISRTNENVREISSLNIKYPNPFSGNGILLVDTPGVNDPENWREEITYNYLSASDAVIMLLDPVQPLSGSEVEFLKDKILASCIEKLIFVVNKIDDIPLQDRSTVLNRIESGLSRYVTTPDIYALSSKQALTAKMNKDENLFISSGFKRFEEYLLEFIMKGRGGALLETKVNKGLAVLGNINENINNRLGALDLEKNIVKKKLNKGKKDLSNLSTKKKDLQKNIKNEKKEIVGELKKVILSRKDHFNDVLKEMIINEPQLSSLRVNVLNFQRETVDSFKNKIDELNKILIEKYRTESIEVMSAVKEVLSSLGAQAKSSTKALKVNKKEETVERTTDNKDIKTGAASGGAVGSVIGAAAASQAIFATSAGLMVFNTLGIVFMGALTGGLGMLAGAGIAAYMKNQKKSETQSHYIESNAIVDNSKACKAVENFLKGMTRQSTAIGGMVITSFIEQAIEPIDRQISDQESLIKNINDDLDKTENDQESLREGLLKHNQESDHIMNDYNSLRSEIQAL